jgi:anti-anti-sigma factor
LHDAVAELTAAEREGEAIIDLGGVTFIDSSGLRALVKVKRTHPAVRVTNPTANVVRLLEVTGLSQVVIDN